ncbi:hypothetical protein ACWD3J_46410 [Streptomyces sp. NPDC002755]|uniref:hypothetical protein n=1 Tax=Streptomyces sp. NPDC002884 TaxID=3154544 RepID=UPI00332913C0
MRRNAFLGFLAHSATETVFSKMLVRGLGEWDMKAGFGSVITAAEKAAEGAGGPRSLDIAISLTVGVLVALAAGLLHRSDRPDPAVAVTYSGYAAVMRAGLVLFGTASLMLAILMSPQQGVSFLVLLLSAVAGVVYGLLAYYDSSTLQAAIWQGTKVTASAAALGQAFLALYGG